MKLATIADGSRDGKLVVVSPDCARYLAVDKVSTLQQAIEQWVDCQEELHELNERLIGGAGESTDSVRFAAPLPRAWQWLDGSAYDTHGDLMQKAFGLDPIETDKPLMYQGMSHVFYGPEGRHPVSR